MRICPGCQINIPEERHKNVKFCTYNCRSNYWNKKVYRQHEWIRKKKKAYFKEWIKKNKDKHKESMRKNYHQNKKAWNVRNYANQQLKKEIFDKFNHECFKCKSKEKLEMHHYSYDTLEEGSYKHPIKNIILLCLKCHRKGHRDKNWQ